MEGILRKGLARVVGLGLMLVVSSLAGLPIGLAAQTPPAAPTSPPQPLPATSDAKRPDAASLQQMLERFDYIDYSEAMSQVDAALLTPAQQKYFLGMLATHNGKLVVAVPLLVAAINLSGDKSLSANQIGSALQTLGEVDLKLGRYAASAQMSDDIDKAFGARMGDAVQTVRDSRNFAGLLQPVPPQTVEISGDFTLQRTSLEYPVSIPADPGPAKQFSAQLDTGTEISLLSASTAKAWGVKLLEGTAKLHGYGGGEFAAQPGYIPTLTIGNAVLHNVAVYVTADENLYISQLKRQTNALLGYPVVAALGRLTFGKDGSLTVSAQSPGRDLKTTAALWLSDHTLLVELGTMALVSGDTVTGSTARRLFVLDTGSESSYLTDHYLAEHTNVFQGPATEVARLVGAGGLHEIPAYAAHGTPLFLGDTVIRLDGQHVLTQPQSGESEHFFGLIGKDILSSFSSYTIDLRNMTLTVSR